MTRQENDTAEIHQPQEAADELQHRWEDPATHQARLAELEPFFTKQGDFTRRNPDGSRTNVRLYEQQIDPLDASGDMNIVREFRLRKAAAGQREAFSPLVVPTYTDPATGRVQRVIIQLGYEKPATTPPPTVEHTTGSSTTPQPRRWPSISRWPSRRLSSRPAPGTGK